MLCWADERGMAGREKGHAGRLDCKDAREQSGKGKAKGDSSHLVVDSAERMQTGSYEI